MNNDDSQRAGMGNPGNRKMGPPKYPEKMPNYSPSTSYNYSPATGFNGGQQHPRRRNDHFKRDTSNMSDRIAKQNDIIIRVLKEIRDRLPPPATQALPPSGGPAESIAPVSDSLDSGAAEAGEMDPKNEAPEPDNLQ
jgi:hypothetical protein